MEAFNNCWINEQSLQNFKDRGLCNQCSSSVSALWQKSTISGAPASSHILCAVVREEHGLGGQTGRLFLTPLSIFCCWNWIAPTGVLIKNRHVCRLSLKAKSPRICDRACSASKDISVLHLGTRKALLEDTKQACQLRSFCLSFNLYN